MCMKTFDDITTYFLVDEITQVGEPVSIADMATLDQDACCTASGGTEPGLVEACFSAETEENVVFTWANNMCLKTFDDVTTYFLLDEITQVGEPVKIADMATLDQDACCTASEGTDPGLLLACFSKETEENVAFTWTNSMCMKSFDSVTTFFLLDEVTQIGEPIAVADVATGTPDDCCTASAGTDPLLLEAC